MFDYKKYKIGREVKIVDSVIAYNLYIPLMDDYVGKSGRIISIGFRNSEYKIKFDNGISVWYPLCCIRLKNCKYLQSHVLKPYINYIIMPLNNLYLSLDGFNDTVFGYGNYTELHGKQCKIISLTIINRIINGNIYDKYVNVVMCGTGEEYTLPICILSEPLINYNPKIIKKI